MNSQGYQGGSCEHILPTCGPSLITPKGQRRDPDIADKKTQTNEIKQKNKLNPTGHKSGTEFIKVTLDAYPGASP